MQVNSQNFAPPYEAYDDFGADDFVVPAGQVWDVDRVEVRGNQFGTQAATANVFLFGDGGTIPGAQTFTQSDIPLGSGQTYPDLDLPIAPPILAAGHYWVSVQANLDFTGGNDWWWEDYAPQFGQPAAFKQPGDGFGDGCTTFATRYSGGCYSLSEATPDQAFRLSGDQAGSKLAILSAKPKHRGRLRLTVNAPNMGQLVAFGSRVQAVRPQVTTIGQVSFVMKPKSSTRHKLRLKPRVKTKFTLVMSDLNGQPVLTKGRARLRR